MGKFHAGGKSKWPMEPFNVGQEGEIFDPDKSGTTKKRASGPKTIQGGLKQCCGSTAKRKK